MNYLTVVLSKTGLIRILMLSKERKIVGLTFAVKVLAALLAFVFHFFLANLLEPQDYGKVSVLLVVVLFLSAFIKQGIEQVVVREFALLANHSLGTAYRDVIFVLLKNAVWVFALGGVYYYFAFALFPSLLFLKPVIFLMVAIALAVSVISFNSAVLRSRQFSTYSMLFSGCVLYSIALLLFLFHDKLIFENTVNSYFVASVVTILISGSFVYYFCYKNNETVDDGQAFHLSKFNDSSRVLFISGFSTLLTQHFVILVLANYVEPAEVAAFNIALKISLLVSLPLLVINSVYAPKIAKLFYEGKIDKVKALYIKLTKRLVLLALFVSLAFIFIGKFVLALFGSYYVSSFPILLILLAGQVVNLALGPVVSIIVMSKNERFHRNLSLLLALLTIVALIVVVPWFSTVGAAVVCSTVLILLNVLSLRFIRKELFH